MPDATIENAYAEGQAAQGAGAIDADCPHVTGTLAAAMWLEGLSDAALGHHALDRTKKVMDADQA
ncbi:MULTISPECIES: hypothetical protein [unclassified Methylobacterium]|uniref:hypothetical protein n=1 Tax=unclassified Methylobacterium TaxID=2615210 RepID=UPI0011C20C69|nr:MULTISPECIES: hypothetical protein [unclassified Methylobacterium]QEE41335.1 hypothetical protein FVA80_22595 [Methylobacterium sp. WL1]TXN57765.1 hypothetical protein FV241_09910 [Methylobacterium sp. WL2]